MPWSPEQHYRLRSAVKGQAPYKDVAQIADVTGEEMVIRWQNDRTALQHVVDELATAIDIMNDSPLYTDCAIRTRVAHALSLFRVDSMEASQGIQPAYQVLKSKIAAPSHELGRFREEFALSACVLGKIYRFIEGPKPALFILRDAWEIALLTSNASYQSLVARELARTLDALGESSASQAVAHLAVQLSQNVQSTDWITNPQLWNDDAYDHSH